jgi:lipopolysaccharide export system permease protein
VILSRYLIREIAAPFALILAVLTVLFASYSAADFLSNAVNGLLPMNMLAALIALRVLIAQEVLIPISLYLAVVLSFGKLNGTSELTAMAALRVSPMRVMGAVLGLSAALAGVVGGLSLFARPWAYEKSHALSKQAEGMLDVNTMEAGTFYVGQGGRQVTFLGRRSGPNSPAQDVFVRIEDRDRTEIIHAEHAYVLPQTAATEGTKILMRGVHIYEIGSRDGRPDRALTAGEMVLRINTHPPEPPAYSSLAASTAQLAKSDAPADIAELEWRLSTPVSTLLLGLLGVPLSRGKPRQSRYTKFGAVILIYSAYYMLCSFARTVVQHGQVPAFPGSWWVQALLGLVLLVTLYDPRHYGRFGHGHV